MPALTNSDKALGVVSSYKKSISFLVFMQEHQVVPGLNFGTTEMDYFFYSRQANNYFTRARMAGESFGYVYLLHRNTTSFLVSVNDPACPPDVWRAVSR